MYCFFKYCLLFAGCMHVFQPHIYEAFPPNLIWVALLISHYIGEGSGRLLTYILGLAIFSTNDHENTWRLYIIILSLPAAVFIVSALLFLDESPRYLVSKGQNEKALAVLHKIAKTNSKQLPEIEKLELEPELGALQEDKTSFWEKLKSVVQTWDILRGMTCIVMIGISCKYITNQMGLVATELVFMSGQSDTTYCDGTEENTYFLDTQDYFILSIFTLVTILAQTLAIIPTYRINFDFKISTVIFLAVSICLVAFLYACPEVWVALLIFSIVQVISVVLELNMSIHLSGLLPTNTRSAVYGMTTFIMYLPLSASPYLIQVLSKESQHYVTTTTISFIGFGFIGALLLPRKIYHNKWPHAQLVKILWNIIGNKLASTCRFINSEFIFILSTNNFSDNVGKSKMTMRKALGKTLYKTKFPSTYFALNARRLFSFKKVKHLRWC